MSTDRDRLAADLHYYDDLYPEGTEPNDECGCYLRADRLIALGWSQFDEIDEERLARALIVAQGANPLIAMQLAAAIAKAYREDTDGS